MALCRINIKWNKQYVWLFQFQEQLVVPVSGDSWLFHFQGQHKRHYSSSPHPIRTNTWQIAQKFTTGRKLFLYSLSTVTQWRSIRQQCWSNMQLGLGTYSTVSEKSETHTIPSTFHDRRSDKSANGFTKTERIERIINFQNHLTTETMLTKEMVLRHLTTARVQATRQCIQTQWIRYIHLALQSATISTNLHTPPQFTQCSWLASVTR